MNISAARIKALLFITGLLLVSNMVLLFLLLNKPAPHSRQFPLREILKNEVGFSDAQMQQYDTLAAHQRKAIRLKFDGLRSGKQQGLTTVAASGFEDSTISAVALRWCQAQAQIDEAMMQHFKAVRSLCTPAQTPKFDEHIPEIFAPKKEK